MLEQGKTVIRLEPVTPENWRLGLAVEEAQKRFVSNSDRILARAWAYRDERSRAFVAYADETPVGMALYYDEARIGAYVFSELFIDARYQRRGYGRETARQMLRLMEDDGRFDRVVLCYIDGNDAARQLYEALGFRPTGERDGDEIIMEKHLERSERHVHR